MLDIRELKTHFFTDEGVVRAVDGATLTVSRGRTLALVGESGCGKSVMARSVLQIVDSPGRIVSGEILFHQPASATKGAPAEPGRHVDLAQLAPRGRQIRAIRGGQIGMVFQEPLASLSPVHTIETHLLEAIHLHRAVPDAEARAMAIELLAKVGIPQPERRINDYPHQLSGGMRQRAMIAVALSCRPALLIADEPTTALDVTTQAQILDLLASLKDEMGMSMMLITHDLGVVAETADDVAVMYLGRVVERASVDALFHDPKHPYTRALLRSIPRFGQGGRRLESIEGMVPHPLARPRGCPFSPRCPSFMPGICDEYEPSLVDAGPDHRAACFLYGGAPAGGPTDAILAEELRLERPNAVGEHVGQNDIVTVAAGHVDIAARRQHGSSNLLEVKDLKQHFPIVRGFLRRRTGTAKAVDGVSLSIREGETLGLVGESGSGKTSLSRAVLRAIKPTSGQILFRRKGGQVVDLASADKRTLKGLRREMQMIFQDPYSSLNPRMTLLDIVGEPLTVNGLAKGIEKEHRVADLLRRVGLRPEFMRRYPHAFSGGERQRIGIARALAPNPRLVVCDEPVSALDVSVRAQTLNLLQDLQEEFQLTYLFVAHDLSVVEHISDRVAVMYAGKLVEVADTKTLYAAPKHPYTEALLSAVP